MSLASMFGCATHPLPYFWYRKGHDRYAACTRCGYSPFVMYVRSAESSGYSVYKLPDLTGKTKKQIRRIARGKESP